jgi:YbbR domain-containing protein
MDLTRLTHNPGLKLGALAVAMLLWFHIATEKDAYERVYAVPLIVEGLPGGQIIAEEVPTTALVRFRGHGKQLLFLPWRDVYVSVDASAIRSRGTRPLRLENVRYQESSDLEAVEVVSPDQVTIEVDRLATVRLPIRPNLEVQVAPGHIQVGMARVQPDSVTLSGPESRIRRLTHIETDTLRIQRSRRPVDREVLILKPDIHNLSLEAEVARITLDVQLIGQRTFEGVSVELEGMRGGGRYLAQPRTARVTVSGGVRVLEGLTDDMIRLVINLAGRTPDGLTPYDPVVEFPEGVTLFQVDPPQFRVTEY